MKKVISFVLSLSVAFCFCACSRNDIKIAQNEKSQSIIQQLNLLSVQEVLDDISNINLYLNPDFNNSDYTVKTVEDKENDTKDINYYLDDTLVYTVYDGYGEYGFVNYTKTASSLDAVVNYFSDGSVDDSVTVKTNRYIVCINALSKWVKYGIKSATITLLADNNSPFEQSVVYDYKNGTATFISATYFDNNDYVRYNSYMEDGVETEYTDTLVYGEMPDVNKKISNVLLKDKEYKYASILMNNNKWYNSNSSWHVSADLCIVFDSEKQAREYMNNNSLNGEITDYGSPVIRISDVTLEIDAKAVIANNQLPSFITNEIDDPYFTTITLNPSGTITHLSNADISLY